MFDYVQISDSYSQGRTIGMVLNPTGFFNLILSFMPDFCYIAGRAGGAKPKASEGLK
jgi:hypothetical protein